MVGDNAGNRCTGSERTPERPAIVTASRGAEMFVVQQHAAHRAGLHWDFRLKQGGVLWSWTVPKAKTTRLTAGTIV
jgi:hypothetical protein